MSNERNDDPKVGTPQDAGAGLPDEVPGEAPSAKGKPENPAATNDALSDALQETLALSPDGVQSEIPEDAGDSQTPSTDDAGWSFSTILHSERAKQSTQTQPELPGFRILEELGRGEFGVVFKAIEEKLDRTVAIKLPLLHEASLREHYISEARNAAKLDSPGIVTVYQVGQSLDEQPFVVQKYVEGHTLANALKTRGTLGVEESVRVIMQIARAIAVAHQGDIVHRDLKPANILMDKSGNPWVADFGLAVFEEDQLKLRDQLAGTPLYMSPEQMRGESHLLDGRTDIWALGIMLYECLCGKTPFHGRSMSEIREQILERDPKPLTQRSPHIPEELESIFRRCCAKLPSDRYPSASKLADDLECFLSKEVTVASTGTQPSMFERNAVTAVVVLALAFAGIAWGVLQSGMFTRNEPTSNRDVVGNGLEAANLRETTEPSASPFNGPGSNDDSGSQPSSDSSLSSAAGRAPTAAGEPLRPRTLLVAADGSGTFETIQAAIEQAEDGAIIEIAPGEYHEQLLVDKPLVLKGVRRNEVRLVGSGVTAVQIIGKGRLILEDVTISASRGSGSDVNAIELNEGMLELVDCTVESSSFNAVHAEPGTELRVDNCDFKTQLHPAIYARQLVQLVVTKSRFQMEAGAAAGEADSTLVVGMQIVDSGGAVSDCTFKGTGAMGIHWKDTHPPAEIENCTFSQLEVGLRLENCGAVRIGSQRGNSFHGCVYGIDIDRCGGRISQCVLIAPAQVIGRMHPSGIKVLGTAGGPLEISDCEINGYANGMQANGARLELHRLDCQHVSIEALSFDSSTANLVASQVNGKTGIRADGGSNIVIDSTTVQSSDLISTNVGVFISGGSSVSVRNESRFIDCFIGSYLEWGSLDLADVTMSGKARGVFVKEDNADSDSGPTDPDHPRQVTAKRVIFSAETDLAIEYRSAGTYYLSECLLGGPQAAEVEPSIFEGLHERVDRNGHTRVEWD